MKVRKPYRIVGAYDSETTNCVIDGRNVAFPILHQLGILDCDDVSTVNPENVEKLVNVETYRHSIDLYERLDSIASQEFEYVPVIMCHNLAFDMYGLSSWLARHDVRVLAKSARKPITFTVRDDDGNPCLVIWDTLIFSQQSLERMGNDCGYSKGVGEWDYDLARTPETPLTHDEMDYAKRDIYTLFAWVSWWISRNPDIEPGKLALNVVTKTGVVRERRRVRFSFERGRGSKLSAGQYWILRNKSEAPKTDDELFTMFAATRGGLTFCASENASRVFDLDDGKRVMAYDATSQHPAQMVSHLYPNHFKEQPAEVLELAFRVVANVSLERVLEKWYKPFPVAFNACFEFVNLRPKRESLYAEHGIYPLASARYKPMSDAYLDDNGDARNTREHLVQANYIDTAENAVCAFGKLVSADKARLYITELTAWEMVQAYEWDSVRAIHGYSTGRFTRPSDMDIISVMQFYKAKDAFKEAREQYHEHGTIRDADKLKRLGVAPFIADGMKDGTLPSGDVESTYLALKADLNALFGVNAANEYRRDTILTLEGIGYEGEFGLCNAPKNPKVWYQFGQRIVGWSRIAQICVMELLHPLADTIINGDTDSIKVLADCSKAPSINRELDRLGIAIDRAKEHVCARVKRAYPKFYDKLEGIGHYVHEFDARQFCASWNKAYAIRDGKGFSFTLAGVPTRRREGKVSSFIGVNGLANRLYSLGWSFADVCNVFLGYNVTYSHEIIRLNARAFPQWGDTVFETVTDYLGNTARIAEPASLALYPMAKTVNDTASAENRENMRYALRNNPDVNTVPKLVHSTGIENIGELMEGLLEDVF